MRSVDIGTLPNNVNSRTGTGEHINDRCVLIGVNGPRDITVKDSRNRRSVWTVNTQPYAEAHFATFPEKLVEPCVLAGSKPGDLVIDPFAGSGTVGVVARRFLRRFVGIELNTAYLGLARKRLTNVQQSMMAL